MNTGSANRPEHVAAFVESLTNEMLTFCVRGRGGPGLRGGWFCRAGRQIFADRGPVQVQLPRNPALGQPCPNNETMVCC